MPGGKASLQFDLPLAPPMDTLLKDKMNLKPQNNFSWDWSLSPNSHFFFIENMYPGVIYQGSVLQQL